MFEVAEHFVSINGESTLAGEPAVFIRFKGCNLKCTYCDTQWANQSDTHFISISAKEIARTVKNTGIVNVTLTGGEPLLQKDLIELTDILISQGNRVEIETNGSISLSELANAKNRPVFTMDYKLPSSGMEKFMCKENFDLLQWHDTVKFVSGSVRDLERAREIIGEYHLTEKCHVYISPVFGKIEPAEIVDFMIKNKMNGIRLQLQLHKFIWEPDRRGV